MEAVGDTTALVIRDLTGTGLERLPGRHLNLLPVAASNLKQAVCTL